MHEVHVSANLSKEELYAELGRQFEAILQDESDGLANSANLSALLYQTLPQLNWAGIYFLKGGELVLGPFQGKVACVRIALNRGVCGAAATRREIVVVPDVDQFPGHIACDSASRSEIVVPLIKDKNLVGVLDLDSPELARFDQTDARGLASLSKLLMENSDFTGLCDPRAAGR